MMRLVRKLVPKPVMSAYHFSLAALSAMYYRFPSRGLTIVGVTGTKGKTSVVELINAILEEAGQKTALASTIRFKVGSDEDLNLFKMTMPGRFFLQQFLRKAKDADCKYVVLEMTSEGAVQYRHRFIELDALIFTNITPEHIESHGSFENYLAAKLSIRDQLESSRKVRKWMIANTESEHAEDFLETESAKPVQFSLKDAEPYQIRDRGIDFTLGGRYIHSPLRGRANLENILAAAAFARTQNIDIEVVKSAIERLDRIPGRGELVDEGQQFSVVVDYAHTPESLEQLYETYKDRRKICVFGATGGGRDKWKRDVFGKLAEKYCQEIILTDEDPYDEDPNAIVEDIARGITRMKPTIEMDRRVAIRRGIQNASVNDVVLITGKGTDPFIMGPRGSKKPWSDAEIARQELQNTMSSKNNEK